MSKSDFTTVRVVGGLIPSDVLGRILVGDKDLGGLAGADYHLASGESAREAANRAWPYLLGAWQNYKQALAKLPDGDPAVGLTREKWLTLLFKELDFGRLQPTPAGGIVIDDKSFPVSHAWGATPLHLLGWGVDLDKRTKGVPGAADRAPQAMVQELLNRTDDYLWAMLSNGRTIRLLRDSTSLAGQAYVEFDLESMFDGEVFSDFVLLYLLLHQSRVEIPAEGIPAECWLEKWRAAAAESGTRALGLLRDGVKEAIEALGTGFLQVQGNNLNYRLADGSLRLEDYHRSLLRLIYRLLFLFVAEDRGLLHEAQADRQSIQRYRDFFSTTHLRDLARKRRGGRHTDLYAGLKLTLHGLATNGGRPELALPGLGGIFTDEPIDVVSDADLPNEALLTAIRKLSIVHPKGSPPRTVDYRNLGAEELGSIYESLLELVPRHDQLDRSFTLELLAGNDRKTSGSYYTPTSLIDLVLDEALDPILDEKEREKDAEQALLNVTVCDPACGSGHFLVAAARRIATRLAAVRTGEADPTPTDVQHALHDVVARCIYGVDLNPMAAELAKVSLWLEAMEPGRPLSFLDVRIKVGNALLGTTPRLIAEGIPDGAFDAIEGDDKKYASSLKKRNKHERDQSTSSHQQGGLFDDATIDVSNAHLRSQYAQAIDQSLKAADLSQLAAAEKRYREAQESPQARRARLIADTWCAAFVQHQQPGAIAITQATVEQASVGVLGSETEAEVDRLASEYNFFHWHLEFPEIFPVPISRAANRDTGWDGGFSVMLGNPPWERLKVQEQEFFAARDFGIARAPNAAARKALIRELSATNPSLYSDFRAAIRHAAAESHFIRSSGRFPFGGVGDINTYAVFANLAYDAVRPNGLAGLVLPVGLLGGYTYRRFTQETVEQQRLKAVLGFENGDFIFRDVHDQIRFCVWVVGGSTRYFDQASFTGRLRRVSEVNEEGRRYSLRSADIASINPNTGTIPFFRFAQDAEIAARVYSIFGVLVPESGQEWNVDFSRTFDMANDSHLFVAWGALENEVASGHVNESGDEYRRKYLPLLEGKMLGLFDSRFGTYEGQTEAQSNEGKVPHSSDFAHQDAAYQTKPRYGVSTSEVDQRSQGWRETFWIGYRRMGPGERSMVCSLVPTPAAGDSVFLINVSDDSVKALFLQAWLASLLTDYSLRQKGSQMSFFIVRQAPVPSMVQLADMKAATGELLVDFCARRSLELSYTGFDMLATLGETSPAGPPFVWSEERRTRIRAELDAAIFHASGLERSDVVWVLDSFRVLREREVDKFSEFRTKRLVLAEYDRMAEAAATGVPYESSLDPAPGFGPRHDASTIPDWFQE